MQLTQPVSHIYAAKILVVQSCPQSLLVFKFENVCKYAIHFRLIVIHFCILPRAFKHSVEVVSKGWKVMLLAVLLMSVLWFSLIQEWDWYHSGCFFCVRFLLSSWKSRPWWSFGTLSMCLFYTILRLSVNILFRYIMQPKLVYQEFSPTSCLKWFVLSPFHTW